MRGLRRNSLDVWESIRAQPARFGLSFLAIAVGMGTLAFLFAVLGGLQSRAHALTADLGARVVAFVRSGTEAAPASAPLTERALEALHGALPDCRLSRARRIEVKEGVSFGVVGADEHLADVRDWSLAEGRWLDARDVHLRERHAVATRALAEARGLELGAVVRVGRVPLTLVGIVDAAAPVAESPSDTWVSSGNRTLFVPAGLSTLWAHGRHQPLPGADAVFLRVPLERGLKATADLAGRMLRQPDLQTPALSRLTPEQLVAGIRKWQRTLRLTAGSVAVLCLVLGGTTLMSLMVANVRERIPEIGLRRSLGARRSDIGSLFMLEGMVVSGLAALAATSVTHTALLLVRGRLTLPIEVGPASVLWPIAAALVLGVAFSFWPARLAMRITPAEALRNE